MGGEAIDELVVDACIHDDPVRAHADLALVQELTDNGRPHRMFQVGIVEDDERRVPAELQRHSLELRGLHRERPYMSPYPRRTSERDQARNGVRRERIADFGDWADDDVEKTGATRPLHRSSQ